MVKNGPIMSVKCFLPVPVFHFWPKYNASCRAVSAIAEHLVGVSDELKEFYVATEIKAQAVHRMVMRNGSRNIVKTGNIIVSFQDEVPEHVYIGCLRYKVRPYVPQPMRCIKCQGFGHTATHCRRQTRCVLSRSLVSCRVPAMWQRSDVHWRSRLR